MGLTFALTRPIPRHPSQASLIIASYAVCTTSHPGSRCSPGTSLVQYSAPPPNTLCSPGANLVLYSRPPPNTHCSPGACLVQVYTALAFDGPKAVPDIKEGLAACLARDGFKSVGEAVGADHRAGGSKDKKKGLLW